MPPFPASAIPPIPYGKGSRSLRAITLNKASQIILGTNSIPQAYDIYSSLPSAVQKDLFFWLLLRARWAEGTKNELELHRQLELAVRNAFKLASVPVVPGLAYF